VILHAVLENAGGKAFTIKQNGEPAEILELKGQLSEDIQKLLERHLAEPVAAPGGYCDLLSAVDGETLASILGSYGKSRFKNKVRRFNAALLLSDFDQVLYEGMMEALGYEKNKLNLLKLAQLVPLNQIRSWQKDGLDAVGLVSILCCPSGLLDRSLKQLSPELVTTLKDAYERQRFFAKRLEIDWQLFRIRPSNHPVHRLFAIGALLHRSREQGLMDLLLEQLQFGKAKPEACFRSFHKLLAESRLPGGDDLPKPGKALSANIYVNIILPILYLYYDKLSDTRSRQAVFEAYAGFPALQENHVTRFMGRYLSLGQSRAANSSSMLQQGLIELFHRYCRYHLCEECRAALPG
jgi:hypothetical protein